MQTTLTIRGRYADRKFIPDDPMPDVEGTAELTIVHSPNRPRGSTADAYGTATVLRSGNEILSQIRAEREEWGDH